MSVIATRTVPVPFLLGSAQISVERILITVLYVGHPGPFISRHLLLLLGVPPTLWLSQILPQILPEIHRFQPSSSYVHGTRACRIWKSDSPPEMKPTLGGRWTLTLNFGPVRSRSPVEFERTSANVPSQMSCYRVYAIERQRALSTLQIYDYALPISN